MQTPDLWTSLQTSHWFQRIYCISPFVLAADKRRLHTPRSLLAYIVVYLTACIATIIISIVYLNIFDYLKEFLPVGFMWIVLSGMEFLFANIAFVLVVVISTTKRSAQISFLHAIAEVDGRLQHNFGTHVDFDRLKRFNDFAWLAMLLYYQGLALVLAVVMWRANLSRLVPIIIVYQLEQATAAGLAFVLANYMLLLRARFRLVRRISEQARQEYPLAVNRRQQDAVVQRLTVVYREFKALCNAMAEFANAFGLIALIRLAHDFTRLNTQLYLVFCLACDARTIHDVWYIGVAFVWMLPNVIKMGSVTVAVEAAVDEVNTASALLDYSYSIIMSIVIFIHHFSRPCTPSDNYRTWIGSSMWTL